jgi:GTP-binding protein Era
MIETPRVTRCGDVALAGAPNVGKSSLLNALVGQPLALVSPKAQATRAPVVGIRTDADTQFVFHDLPGLLDPRYLLQERMLQAAQRVLDRVDVVLYLNPVTADHPVPLAVAAHLSREPRCVVLPVFTKGDLVDADARAKRAATGPVVSAPNAWGIENLMTQVARHLPEGPFRFDPDDVGTQPLRFFATEYVREAAFEVLDQELPYALAAEVEEFRENERPMYIRVTIVVERDSQKGMVVGKGGRTIKRIGTLARRRLEELVGAPVYLDLWAKVLKNWRKSPAALSRLGFPPPDKETA